MHENHNDYQHETRTPDLNVIDHSACCPDGVTRQVSIDV